MLQKLPEFIRCVEFAQVYRLLSQQTPKPFIKVSGLLAWRFQLARGELHEIGEVKFLEGFV